MNKRITLGLLALVGWAVFTICITGCAPKRVPVVWANLSGPYLGFTTCDTTGQVVILLNASDEVNMADYGLGHVLLHEQIHVTQVAREGSCRKFMKKYNEDKKFAFDIEAEAYCGELEFRVLKGASRVTLFANLVRHMKTMAPFWTPEQVAEALPCNGGSNEKGDPDTRQMREHPRAGW